MALNGPDWRDAPRCQLGLLRVASNLFSRSPLSAWPAWGVGLWGVLTQGLWVGLGRDSKKRHGRRGKKGGETSAKARIMKKKDRRRLQGKDTKSDSKFTGRKRGPKF